MYHLSAAHNGSDNVYQKAVQDYEEYKRITKNNLHDNKDGDSDNEYSVKTNDLGTNGLNVKGVSSKQLNNAGRSVLTYKKLVSCIKSPYANGVVINNLNKAYLPSKLKRSRKYDKRNKKSSTPNLKVRKYGKEYSPVLQQFQPTNCSEQEEITKIKSKQMQEQEEELKRQHENIESLKNMQNDLTNQEHLSNYLLSV